MDHMDHMDHMDNNYRSALPHTVSVAHNIATRHTTVIHRPMILLATLFSLFAASASTTLSAAPSKQGAAADYARGQIIVKYKDSVTLSVREVVKNNLKFKDTTLDSSDSLDILHQKFKVGKAKPIFRTEAEEDAIPGQKTLKALKELHAKKFEDAKKLNPSVSTIVLSDSIGPDVSQIYTLDISPDENVETAVQAFASDPHVEYAQPNYIAHTQLTPNDTYWPTSKTWGQTGYDLWGLHYNNTNAAWDISKGAGVTVAVVDTGIDYNHPDIATNLVPGWNFITNTSDAMDDHGHGTHMAGIIAAAGNNSQGIIGVAYQAKIMPLKAFDQDGNGTTANDSAALVYAAQHGARIINNSWGCDNPCPSNPVAEDAVRTAYALGSVVVFSAGNFSSDVYDYSPTNMSQVIVAAASTLNDKPTYFSNYGTDIDVSAPGTGITTPPFLTPDDPNFRNILSLKAANCNTFLFCPPELVVGTNYLRGAGTSMSAAYVSGLAALIVSKHPTYTAEQVRQVIRITAQDINGGGNDAQTGYGRLRPNEALKALTPVAAQITLPTVGTTAGVTLLPVRGITGGPGFKDWSLYYGVGTAPTSGWKTLIKDARTATSITQDGLLTNWNISALTDGHYTLKLTVRSTNGKTYEDRQLVVIDQTAITTQGGQAIAGGKVFQSNVTFYGIAAGGKFAKYRLEVHNSKGELLVNPNITLTNGGLQKIYNGVLGTWNTAGVPADNYTVDLVVTLTNGTTNVKTTDPFIYDATVHPGWPLKVGPSLAPVTTGLPTLVDHLVTADVNLDGTSDLIVGYGNTVRIYDHNGTLLPGWPQTVDPLGTGCLVHRSPVAADLDGDGRPEIIVANKKGMGFVWHADGSALAGWPIQLTNFNTALVYQTPSVTVAAIDGTATPRIILTTQDGWVHVLDITGANLPGWPRQVDTLMLGPPAVGDMNGDGLKEIIVSSVTAVYALDSLGNLLPNWPKAIPALGIGWSLYPALGDLAGDGTLRVVVGLTDLLGQRNAVYVFGYDGANIATMATPGLHPNPPALADLNGDGKIDVVAGNLPTLTPAYVMTEYLNAWHGDGTVFGPAWPVAVTDANGMLFNVGFGFSAPALTDIEGGGQVNIIASNDVALFALDAYRPDGTHVTGFPKPTVTNGSHESNAVAVADIDGDGLLEIAWTDANLNLWVWDLPTLVTTTKPWPMFRRDPEHSGSTR